MFIYVIHQKTGQKIQENESTLEGNGGNELSVLSTQQH